MAGRICQAVVWVLQGERRPGQGEERRSLPWSQSDQQGPAEAHMQAADEKSGSGVPLAGKWDSRAPVAPPPSLVYIGFSALPKCPLTSPQSVKIPKIAG
jgi:hypothetical protein